MIVNAVPGQTVASSQVTRSNYTLQLTTTREKRSRLASRVFEDETETTVVSVGSA